MKINLATKAYSGSGSKPPEQPKPLYDRAKDKVTMGSIASVGTAIGYVLGCAAGGGAHNAGGSVGYTYFVPAAGAAIGGMAGMAFYNEVDNPKSARAWGQGALTTGLATGGTMLGDAIGHGLSHLTGNPIYQNLGPLAGGLNGALGGLHAMSKEDDVIYKATKYALPTMTGLTSGTVAGTLAGALLSHLTGSGLYSTLAPILGGLGGGMTGLALTLNANEKRSEGGGGE